MTHERNSPARRTAVSWLICLAGCVTALAQEQTARIEGTITGADTGAALACAVVALTAEHENARLAFPDETGAFGFAAVAPGYYRLAAHAPGYRIYTVPFYAAPGTIRTDFLMTRHDASRYVQGTVLAQESGLPIAGAHINALLDGERAGTSYACPSGDYEVTFPDEFKPDIVWLQVSAPGRAPSLFPAGVSQETPADVWMQLAPMEGNKPCSVLGCGADFVENADDEQSGPLPASCVIAAATLLLLPSRPRVPDRGTRPGIQE